MKRTWPFSVFKYEGRWCIAINGIHGGPGISLDPYEDDETWPTLNEAMAALDKWANDRGLVVALDDGAESLLRTGQLERAA